MVSDKAPTHSNDSIRRSNAARTDDSLLSEDYHFCKLARDNGYKVWAAPWVVLSHIGTYLFTGGLHARPKPSAVVG